MNSHYDALMNFPTENGAPMGVVNPELTESLATAMSPYVDEMAGRNIDNSSKFEAFQNSSGSAHEATRVFSVLDTNDKAADIMNQRSAEVQADYIREFTDSAVVDPSNPIHSSLMENAGQLKGITEMGALNAANDVIGDNNNHAKEAHDMVDRGYSVAVAAAGTVPVAGPGMALAAEWMRGAIVGPDPTAMPLQQAEIQRSMDMQTGIAQSFVNHGMATPEQMSALGATYNDATMQWELPNHSHEPYSAPGELYRSALGNYLATVSAPVNDALRDYDQAYRDVID